MEKIEDIKQLNNTLTFINVFTDYVKGIGPFGSPFAFLSYGKTYDEMLDFAKSSPEVIDFIFDFIINNKQQSVIDKSINVLMDTGLSIGEIKEKIIAKIIGVKQ